MNIAMKIIATLPLAAAFAIAAAPASAASPFDGTWKLDIASAKLASTPDIFLLSGGQYGCQSCIPPFTIPADGKFHPVTGHAYYDAVAVKVLSPEAISIATRKADKIVFVNDVKVSPDGKTLTMSTHRTNSMTGATSDGASTATRIAAAPAGAHGVSGSWRETAIQSSSDSSLLQTMMVTGNALTLSQPTGEGYTATFGGPAVLQKNDPGKTMVQLKKLADNHIVETDSRDAKPVLVYDMVAQPDGRTIAMTVTDKRDGSVSVFTLMKQ